MLERLRRWSAQGGDGTHIIVDGHPNFVRPSIVDQEGAPPANLDVISATACPNTGAPCPWLQRMAQISIGYIGDTFSEDEVRKMQLAMEGFSCLAPDQRSDPSVCDPEATLTRLTVSVEFIQARLS